MPGYYRRTEKGPRAPKEYTQEQVIEANKAYTFAIYLLRKHRYQNCQLVLKDIKNNRYLFIIKAEVNMMPYSGTIEVINRKGKWYMYSWDIEQKLIQRIHGKHYLDSFINKDIPEP